MNEQEMQDAAAVLWRYWEQSLRFHALPEHCRPSDRAEEYAIQERLARVSAPQLVADNACACWFLLGPAAGVDWRDYDLVQYQVVAYATANFRAGEAEPAFWAILAMRWCGSPTSLAVS